MSEALEEKGLGTGCVLNKFTNQQAETVATNTAQHWPRPRRKQARRNKHMFSNQIQKKKQRE